MMNSVNSANETPGERICSNCKQPVPDIATYCPFCGQASPQVSESHAIESTREESWITHPSGEHPAGEFEPDTTLSSPPPVVLQVYGAFMPAAPFIPERIPATSGGKGGRRRSIAAVAAALLLAIVLGIGGYTLYNVFAANDESAAARILPGSTLVYASVDIVQYAKNSHGFGVGSLFLTGSLARNDPLRQLTGLDWQSDILPWVDRDIAVAAFQLAASGDGRSAGLSGTGGAILIQSKSDSAAQAAMKKAASFQKSNGHSITQSAYGGFTLLGVDAGGTPTFTAGDGWAIIASNGAAAKTIIDRIDGKGDILADSQAYQSATSNLPSDQFGAVFVNIKALAALAAGAGGAVAGQLASFAALYPVAGGFLEWTSSGLRAQITLRAATSLGIGNLQGDTTALAALVPSSAVLYAGVGNLGAEALAAGKMSSELSTSRQSADPLRSLFGVSASNPVFHHPAALVETGGRDATPGAPGTAFLLKTPDVAAAATLVEAVADSHQLTLQPLMVDGQMATGFYSTSGLAALPAPFSIFPTAPVCAGCAQFAGSPRLVAVAAEVNGTLVIGSSSPMVASIIETAKGASSLAKAPNFRQLTKNAPDGAATSLFVNLSSLSAMLGGLKGQGVIGALLANTSAMLITSSSNDQESQTTVDLKVTTI